MLFYHIISTKWHALEDRKLSDKIPKSMSRCNQEYYTVVKDDWFSNCNKFKKTLIKVMYAPIMKMEMMSHK